MKRANGSVAENIEKALIVGISGAISVVVLDSLIARSDSLSGRMLGRAAARIGAAILLAEAVRRTRAPSGASVGVVAGPVLVGVLDLGTHLLGRPQSPAAAVRTGHVAKTPPAPGYTVDGETLWRIGLTTIPALAMAG